MRENNGMSSFAEQPLLDVTGLDKAPWLVTAAAWSSGQAVCLVFLSPRDTAALYKTAHWHQPLWQEQGHLSTSRSVMKHFSTKNILIKLHTLVLNEVFTESCMLFKFDTEH